MSGIKIVDCYAPSLMYIYLISGPIDVSPGISPGDSCGQSNTKGNNAGSGYSITRWMIIVRGVSWIPPWAIHHSRVINWNIDDLGTCGFDHDCIFLHNYHLLVRCCEVTQSICFGSKVLNRVHHLLFLSEKGISNILGPLQFVAQHGQDRGKVH